MGNYTKYLHVELNELGLGRFISVTFCVLISLCLSGCEAQLNTQGIEKTLSQSIRRTDQLMTIVQRKDGSQLIAGNNGLLLSRDNASGKWLRETLSREGVNPNFIGSSVCPDGTVVLLAYENQIWWFKDNWQSSALPTDEEVQAVSCSPLGDIWVTGSFSTILVSRDNFNTWTETSMGEDSMLTAITFISPSKGYIVGEFGLILTTSNGGDSWEHLDPISDEFYPLSAHFEGDQQGWVGGLQGVIMHTSDGGKTWNKQVSSTQAPIYNFIRNESLYATGDQGSVLSLEGSKWIAVPATDIPTYFRSGIASDTNTLLLVGGWGVVLPVTLNNQTVER